MTSNTYLKLSQRQRPFKDALYHFKRDCYNHMYSCIAPKNYYDSITQIYYRAVRPNLSERIQLKSDFNEIIRNLIIILSDAPPNSIIDSIQNQLHICYKLIAHTRDIKYGPGEYSAAYALLLGWYEAFQLSPFAITRISGLKSSQAMLQNFLYDFNNDPFGSFKDFKILCLELINHSRANLSLVKNKPIKERNRIYPDDLIILKNHKLISTTIDHLVKQIIKDINALTYRGKISLLAKWLPRENSKKYGQLVHLIAPKLAEALFKDCTSLPFKMSNNSSFQYHSVIYKTNFNILTIYRKCLSVLNKNINTLETYLCNNENNIDPKFLTSMNISKYWQSLFISPKDNFNTKFSNYLIDADKPDSYAKFIPNNNISIGDIVRFAINAKSHSETCMVNTLWNVYSKQLYVPIHAFPIIDISCAQLNGNNLGSDGMRTIHTAIGLGIAISEKSKIKNRICLLSSYPKFIHFTGQETFCQKVNLLYKEDWGLDYNIYNSMNVMVQMFKETEPAAKQSLDLNFIFIGIGYQKPFDRYDKRTIDETIRDMFQNANLSEVRICNTEHNNSFSSVLPAPKLIFWNMRSASINPTSGYLPRVQLMCGYSPQPFFYINDGGIQKIPRANPVGYLTKMLDRSRYNRLISDIPIFYLNKGTDKLAKL